MEKNNYHKGGELVAWVYLVIASLGEIFGVLFINLYIQKKSISRLLLLIAHLHLDSSF